MNRHLSPLRRLSAPHVVLVHLMVLLTAMPPTAAMADMLTSNVLGGAAANTGTPAPAAPGAGGAADAAAAAAAARANAQDMLTRNTLALQSVQAMQEAARAAAAGANNAGANPNFPGQTLPDVPNGLGTGGLDLVSAAGALTPQQSQENARTIVTIQQQQQQAMLEWKTFNVGSQTTLKFDQSAGGADAGSWIAFNRVTDPSGNPTQILGSIQAQGQVYVINQNGIIFGGASEVNTHTLVASALPLNDNLVTRGLLNNPDSQFLFSANAQAAGSKGPTPAYAPPSPPASGRIGNVTVQAGARLTAPTSSANVGGRVALIGPNVTNNGSISTPDGQAILAAGMEVGFDAHSGDDPSLRGLDVYVGSVGTYGGTATNAGLIQAPRGSVVITGKTVNQNGFINSTTSAALNGRIDLRASYNAIPNTNFNASLPALGAVFVYPSGTSTGIVSTGAGSVMQILPEYDSALKVVGTELALKSQVNVQGLAIYLGSGSVIMAPNADVVLAAGVWDLVLRQGTTNMDFVSATGQIFADQGAIIDVAGSAGVAASLAQYILTIDLRSAEFADSPLQRNSALRGQTVTVDLRERGVRSDGTEWVGTPLADLTGYLGVVERNVGQLTTSGGTVTMTAGDSVVMQSGSKINVSGGYQQFEAGTVATTRLIKDGTLVDIADADASVVYDGVYDPAVTVSDPRWGTTTTTTGIFGSNAHAEAAHVYGGAGGSLHVSAAAMALDGTLAGRTVIGQQQLDAAPAQASLSLEFKAQQLVRTPLVLPFHSPTPPRVEFRHGAAGLAAADAFALDGSGAPLALRQDRRDSVVLSPDLLAGQGFGSLLVNNGDGEIVVPAGVTLAARAGGAITLQGANIDVQGSIITPGGAITLTAYNISPYATAILGAQGATAVLPGASATRGRITLGSGAVVSTAGLVVDNRDGSPLALTLPLSVAQRKTYAGGNLSLSGYFVELASGSLLDVSGGLVVSQSITYGDGGALSIKAGSDPLLTSLLGGHLTLGGTLRGVSGSHGGALALRAPTIQVGGTAALPNTLLLQPEFFSTGGFSKFSLTGLGTDITPPGGAETFAPAVLIADGTVIRPVVSRLQATATRVGGVNTVLLQTLVNPEGFRDAAVLEFLAPGVNNFATGLLQVRGHVQMGAGARIETDALGQVTLRGQTVEVLGEIFTPGGRITVAGADHYPTNTEKEVPTAARATLHLGAGSRLSAAGKVVILPGPYGRREGFVHAGGTIEIGGNIIADTGATLDVSGTTGVLDLTAAAAGRLEGSLNALIQLVRENTYFATQVDSNAGRIFLQGGDFLFSNATLIGRAGGTTGQGGTLSVNSGKFIMPSAPNDDKDITLLVAQNMAQFSQPVFAGGVIGGELRTGGGAAIEGIGYFGADSFATGGFDSLSLAGNVQFQGAVTVAAAGSLRVADGGVLGADALVRLSAAHVALGRALGQPMRDEELINPYIVTIPGVGNPPSVFSPTYGAGRLEVTAELIETGFLSLQNIGQAALTARQDLRGSGYLDIAGHLTLTAGQIYPVTASTFTITAYNYSVGGVATNGSVTIASSGTTPEFPLSGGGRLNIYASTITQGGTLRAPLGTIRLGWDGSGTAPVGLVTKAAVPVTQQVTLAAGSLTSVSAIDPHTGEGVRLPYGIVKDGTNWIDPTGFDITSTGAPDKWVRVAATNVTTEAGSVMDIRGGGELYGYRWVEGNGGSVDILAAAGSFAILPGYASMFAPYAPYASTGVFVDNLGGDKGYVNDSLSVGDRIYIQGNALVAAGSYTLLPARYALLPGAFLVTPSTGRPVDSFVKPGGAAVANGYLFNGLNPGVSGTAYQQFELAPLSVVKARAEYVDHTAQTFLPAAQQRLNLPVSLTSLDAGYTLISALQNMQLNGGLLAAGSGGGRGGRVDISSPLDIVIAAPGAPAQAGKLVLNAALLSGWNAESLLIGGERAANGATTTITARTNHLEVNNAGSPLTGSDIVLVAKESVSLAAGAVVSQTGAQTVADTFVVNGNGALLRVSGVAGALTSRTGVTTSTVPLLSLGAGTQVSGASITLDSTNATLVDLAAILSGRTLNLNSGRLSILLDSPGALRPDAGLVLGGALLSSLQAADHLSLLSYSSIDLYGTGAFTAAGSLALHAGDIRGFNHGAGSVSITAQSVLLDNSGNSAAAGVVAPMTGTLNVAAENITIGQNALMISQYGTVALSAGRSLTLQGSGSLGTQGDLNLVTPYITAASGSTQSVNAGGALVMTRPGAAVAAPAALQLGAQLTFSGASVDAGTDILLPSGALSLHARTGGLVVRGRLDTGGAAVAFHDVVKHTNAGSISLAADTGAVAVAGSSTINVSAAAAGGNAGTFTVRAPTGLFTMDGTLLGTAGTGGTAGVAEIDVGSLASFNQLNTVLNNGAFTESRTLRVRVGDVTIDGMVNAHRFLLGVDQGSIVVNGTINAAGRTGGRIDLIASGSVVLNSGATLTVAAQEFDSAGKGGAVWLEAGSYVNGASSSSAILNVAAGSTINLSVAAANASSAARGQFTGTLHLRAPQTAAGTEVTAIQAISGAIQNASSIVVEGYKVFDLTGSGAITTTVQNTIKTNGQAFGGVSAAIAARLLAGRADDLSSLLVVLPGAEVVNRTGSLTLGTTTSAASADWNLASYRYGPKNAPGVLTLRAAGNLEFYNTLSDGFNLAVGGNAVERMWLATLMTQNTTLPANVQSWSYRMTAGADFSAANFRAMQPVTALGANAGSLLIGKDAGQARPTSAGANSSPGVNALTRLAINPGNFANNTDGANRFQVIRTGTGDIEIFAGRDVRLLNQFATIYTAGVQVLDPAKVVSTGDFVLPQVTSDAANSPDQGTLLGALQQLYPVQYSLAGGNVSVTAQADIIHLTNISGTPSADSSRQLPNNWLMRRGYINPATGEYGDVTVTQTFTRQIVDPSASTTWWVNFSNFFDGVGALGGGNVLLHAGKNVQNVSAHAPTNSRAASGTPDPSRFLELGGGDVTVIAGGNIDGGIYYVERGKGLLDAGGAITTNATRSPSLAQLVNATGVFDDPSTWLPTTLFVGKSSFDVRARGDLLLGPVANTFLLPQGLTNRFWYKTYFSTYSAASSVTASSLGGNVTIRSAATPSDTTAPQPILGLWMRKELLLNNNSAANYQPWLRLAETDVTAFNTFASVMPSSVRATAFSGSLNLAGGFNLNPSPTGTVELLAAGSIVGLNKTGASTTILLGSTTNVWASATINLSDASPASIPGIASPYTYYDYLNRGTSFTAHRTTVNSFLNSKNTVFVETGSTSGSAGVVQFKQTLHAAGILHLNDPDPVRIYAGAGDVSGLTLYAGKSSKVVAGRDVTDIGLYIQNVRATDVSVVSSGRDLIAYNENSLSRVLAVSSGSLPASTERPKSGDIQISGPGTLQVFAGRDLDLGTGSNSSDGTGVGITSIGNGRNPYLPFAGADIIVAAGLGGAATSLGGANAPFDAFLNALLSELTPPAGQTAPGLFDTRRYLSELVEQLLAGGLRGLPDSILAHDPAGPAVALNGATPTWLNVMGLPIQIGGVPAAAPSGPANSINLNDPALTAEQRNQLGLALYFLALRDAGRDRNNPDSMDVNTYRAGYEAIMKLFPVADAADGTPGLAMLMDRARPISAYPFSGNIQTQARDIRTKSGGNISILTPGGGLAMASTLIGETLAPPGIITESGGNISIFADQDVSIGIARIFTLRGGDINIWSTVGDIAAGSSSKTVQSAPPTRVLIDPQSANVATDLAGLATGGGIGVLATVAEVPPGNVDLIAPVGAVDAGDAGIRATGNLNIAAAVVLNAANISVGGSTAGAPSGAAVAAPSLGSVASAAAAGAATTAASKEAAPQGGAQQAAVQEQPSIITVEVIGYGGGTGEDDEERRRNQPGE